jgi:nucleolin
VFVGNLSFYTTNESLGAVFAELGNVTDVRIALDQDGNSRGFGHVEYDSTEAANSAV